MAPSISDDQVPGDGSYDGDGTEPESEQHGPDPVIGAGTALLGIFLMGTGGAASAHYVFDVGVLVAVAGAGMFVLFIALEAMKQRRAA